MFCVSVGGESGVGGQVMVVNPALVAFGQAPSTTLVCCPAAVPVFPVNWCVKGCGSSWNRGMEVGLEWPSHLNRCRNSCPVSSMSWAPGGRLGTLKWRHR